MAFVAWRRLADISTASWLWSLLPSGIASVTAGWLARGEGLPRSVALLIALGVLALVMIILAGWRIWRTQAEPQTVSPPLSSDFHDTLDRYADMGWSVNDEIELQNRKQAEANHGYSEEWKWQAAKLEGRTKIERDKPLGEALAYAGLGRWGGQFFDAVAHGIGEANVPLRKFEQLAYDGRLHVWGKGEQHRDLYEEIPREHWKNNHVEWFGLLRGKPRTEPRKQAGDPPYYDLMVSRAEFEQAMPYIGQPD